MPTISFYCVICGTALEAPCDSQYDLAKCHSCSRHVPVPRPASLVGNHTRFQAVFPPAVLELSVTFLCGECGSRLRADARREGRKIDCPICSKETEIPRWSTVPSWSAWEAGEKSRVVPARPPRPPRPPIRTEAAALSAEEIEFLRGEASVNPEAAA